MHARSSPAHSNTKHVHTELESHTAAVLWMQSHQVLKSSWAQRMGAGMISSHCQPQRPPLVLPLQVTPLWRHLRHHCHSPMAAAAPATGCALSCRVVWSAMLCCASSKVGPMTYHLPPVSSMRRQSRRRWRIWAAPWAGLYTDRSSCAGVVHVGAWWCQSQVLCVVRQ